jgi:imidazolonepropionase-like amidohydrolase
MDQFRHMLVGWLFDGSGGPVRRETLVTLSKGRMAWLEKQGPEYFRQREIEDLRSCTLVPGFVDAHVHLVLSGTEDGGEREAQRNADFEGSSTRIRDHLREHIRHGVVAVRDGGDKDGHALLYKHRVLAKNPSPVAVKAAGQGWHVSGRYGNLIGGSPQTGETLAQAVARRGAENDFVKIVNSGLNSLTRFGAETAPQFALEELVEAVKKAHGLGKKVMVHANGRIPVGSAVDAGCDSIEHGFFMGRENLEKMAERQTVWIPTVFTMAAYAEKLAGGSRESEVAKRNLDHQLNQIRLARSLGVPVGVGTDSGSLGVHHGQAFCKELQLLMTAGFSLEEAVQSATVRNAALLGVEDHTGMLAPGKPATFVVVRGGPERLMEGLRSPQLVVVRGAVASGDKDFLSQRRRGSNEEF